MTTTTSNTVLLTGFAPFGGESTNPSWEAVRQLHGKRIKSAKVHAHMLPVEFGASVRELSKVMRSVKPSLVICVGQAGGRTGMSLERVAINVDDARIADNAGAQPVDTEIVEGGPAAYFSSLPIKAIHRDLTDAGVPAHVSQTAGTYVCNHVFYGLMHAIRNRRGVRGGFIHIPFSPEQAAGQAERPSMDIDTVVKGLRVVVATALATGADIRRAGGAEC